MSEVKFDPALIKMLRNSVPKAIAESLVNVQPMDPDSLQAGNGCRYDRGAADRRRLRASFSHEAAVEEERW